MGKKATNKKDVCLICAKELKPAVCKVCDGKGYYRVWLVIKRDCAICSGSGRALRCPNEYQHVIKDLNFSQQYSANSLYKNFRKMPLPKTPSVAKKPVRPILRPQRPQVPPPWHPSYPSPWHPMHPRNPRNQPLNPLNPNSPNNPNNPMKPLNPMNPLNPNNLMRKK
jgi:hypothetical protein